MRSRLFLLASIIASGNAARPSFPSRPTSWSVRRTLAVRGGAGPLDAKATADIAAGVGLAIGTANTVSPEAFARANGIEETNKLNLLVLRRIGGANLTFFFILCCMLLQDATAHTAVGLSGVFLIVELFKTLFDGTCPEEFPAAGQLIVLGVTAALTFVLLSEHSPISKDVVLRVHSGWNFLNGAFLGFFPEAACKAWGDIDAKEMERLQYWVSLWGYCLMAVGVLSGALGMGVDPKKALAYGGIPLLLNAVSDVFITKRIEALGGYNKGSHYFFILFWVVTLVTMLF